MSKSMYKDTPILDDHHFGTFNFPVISRGFKEINLLEGVRTFEYILKAGDRPDHLAARFFNDEGYWWLICMVNTISYPFSSGGWTPGRALKIPFNPGDVLEKIQK